MTVSEIYRKISERIPESLRESWDNDGLMCSADVGKEVRRVLISLDVTDEVIEYAIEKQFDLIVSHHPLIFRPLKSLCDNDHVARKVMQLVGENISVISLHTRADKVEGGVNDRLCEVLGLTDVTPLGPDGLGRVGMLPETEELIDFAFDVKNSLSNGTLLLGDAYNPVRRVALVGGDGGISYVKAAIEAGADTYLSGRIGYNTMQEAAEMGINLVEAGHYFTEFPVTSFFEGLLLEIDPTLYTEILPCNKIRIV